MAMIDTKKSALFLKSGATLPTLPANYLEITEPLLLNPSITLNEYQRLNGLLNSSSAYVDTCDVTISQTVTHNIRTQNSAGTALGTLPEYTELLKIGGFEVAVVNTLGAETVTFKNTQAPIKGSAIVLLDGNKHTSTNSLIADVSLNFSIGKAATISATLQGFIDNGGIATTVAMPTVTLNPEPVMIVSCADVLTAAGVVLTPDSVTIKMGASVAKRYGMGLKEFSMDDYKATMEISFNPDNANYNNAMQLLNDQTLQSIILKAGTNATGALINGKSMLVTCTKALPMSNSDADDNGKLKRTFTYSLQNDSTLANAAITIKQGFFA